MAQGVDLSGNPIFIPDDQTSTATNAPATSSPAPSSAPPAAPPQSPSFQFGFGNLPVPQNLNLSDPNELALTGLASAQRTTQPYSILAGQSSGSGPGNTFGTDTLGKISAGSQGFGLLPNESFSYNPIQNTPESNLNLTGDNRNMYYTPLDNNLNIPTAQAGAQSVSLGDVPPSNAQIYSPYLSGAAQFGADPNSVYSATGAQAATLDPNSAAQYQAAQAGYAQNNLPSDALVQNQFADITKGVTDGQVPDWARTAVTAARQQMNSLGLGASTMAAGATASAILQAGLPIAQQNAQAITQANAQTVANIQASLQQNAAATNAARQYNAGVVNSFMSQVLSNQQQANLATAQFQNDSSKYNASVYASLNLQNLANSQQSLLSNQAAFNSARQFNAQSQQQNGQYFASLYSQILAQNADRQTAISQFNAGQQNSMQQFLQNQSTQRQEFNSQNQLLVDQSNVQWRRAVNTANTAGVNAANQANTQNAFNLTQTDQNLLWQQARDEASWALTSSENSQNRLLSLVNSALNRQTSLQILASQLNANTFSQLGGLAANLLGGNLGSSLTSGIGSLFGGSSSSSSALDSASNPFNNATFNADNTGPGSDVFNAFGSLTGGSDFTG